MNHFARFGLEPSPWIDPEALKEGFLDRSADAHPDKAAAADKPSSEEDFQDLNASYNILRNSRARLLHFLELAGIQQPEHSQVVPPTALELFPTVAAATKRADGVIKQKTAAHSPMLKVEVMTRALEEVESLQDLQGEIASRIARIEGSLKEFRIDWPPASPSPAIQEIREAAAALGFLERWKAQLQERIVALTF